jgi:hypothetical protein
MVHFSLEFPVLTLKEGNAGIFASGRSTFGFVSKGGESFYKKMTIYDSNGNVYRLKQSKVKGRANLWMCIRLFQVMYELDLDFELIGQVTLSDFKELVINKLNENPTYWVSLDTVKGITDDIKAESHFQDIIRRFI